MGGVNPIGFNPTKAQFAKLQAPPKLVLPPQLPITKKTGDVAQSNFPTKSQVPPPPTIQVSKPVKSPSDEQRQQQANTQETLTKNSGNVNTYMELMRQQFEGEPEVKTPKRKLSLPSEELNEAKRRKTEHQSISSEQQTQVKEELFPTPPKTGTTTTPKTSQKDASTTKEKEASITKELSKEEQYRQIMQEKEFGVQDEKTAPKFKLPSQEVRELVDKGELPKTDKPTISPDIAKKQAELFPKLPENLQIRYPTSPNIPVKKVVLLTKPPPLVVPPPLTITTKAQTSSVSGSENKEKATVTESSRASKEMTTSRKEESSTGSQVSTTSKRTSTRMQKKLEGSIEHTNTLISSLKPNTKLKISGDNQLETAKWVKGPSMGKSHDSRDAMKALLNQIDGLVKQGQNKKCAELLKTLRKSPWGKAVLDYNPKLNKQCSSLLKLASLPKQQPQRYTAPPKNIPQKGMRRT